MGTYAMHSVHFEIDAGKGIVFKAKEGTGKIKMALIGSWTDHEMSKEEFDSLLGELEGLRERIYS